MFGHPIVGNGTMTTDNRIRKQRRQFCSIRVVAVVAGDLSGKIDRHGSRRKHPGGLDQEVRRLRWNEGADETDPKRRDRIANRPLDRSELDPEVPAPDIAMSHATRSEPVRNRLGWREDDIRSREDIAHVAETRFHDVDVARRH